MVILQSKGRGAKWVKLHEIDEHTIEKVRRKRKEHTKFESIKLFIKEKSLPSVWTENTVKE